MNEVKTFILENFDRTVRQSDPTQETLIALPYPYSVPCLADKFQELYYWDTYFINVGLLTCQNLEQAKNNMEDMAHLIATYGFIPNGSRTFFLNRSQPPFFSQMVKEYYEATKDVAWLKTKYDIIAKEYQFWMTQRVSETGLNHFGGAVEDDEVFALYQEYVRRTGEVAKEETDRAELRRLAECYRAICESGRDCSRRLIDVAADLNAVTLNALLYGLECNMVYFSEILHLDGSDWQIRAQNRKALVDQYLWDEEKNSFFDYNFSKKERQSIFSPDAFYPLFCGLASQQQAQALVEKLPLLEVEYGIAASEKDPRGLKFAYCQWDYPMGWAPDQYLVVKALDRYGYRKEAKRIAQKYLLLVEKVFADRQNLFEKYEVVEGKITKTRENSTPPMMGWTAGVYLALSNYIEKDVI